MVSKIPFVLHTLLTTQDAVSMSVCAHNAGIMFVSSSLENDLMGASITLSFAVGTSVSSFAENITYRPGIVKLISFNLHELILYVWNGFSGCEMCNFAVGFSNDISLL
jgi:hypothetical protein